MKIASRIVAASAVLIGVASATPHRQQAEPTAQPTGSVASLTFNFVPGHMVGSLQFAVTLKRDGTAIYATKDVKGAGTFKATGLQDVFADAVKKVDACGYWQLRSSYGRTDSTFPYGVISVATNATRKTIIDAGASKPHSGKEAPEALKQVERTLAQLIQSAHWQKVSDKATFTHYSPNTDSEG